MKQTYCCTCQADYSYCYQDAKEKIENSLTFIILGFNGSKDAELHLWSVHMNASLRERDVAEAVSNDKVIIALTAEALKLIISTLEDSSLSASQSCAADRKAKENALLRFIGMIIVKKLRGQWQHS